MSMSATSLPARKPPLPTPQSGESLRRGERRWVVVSGRCALSGALSASWVRVRARLGGLTLGLGGLTLALGG